MRWFWAFWPPRFAAMKTNPLKDKRFATKGDIACLKVWIQDFLKEEMLRLANRPKAAYISANEAARLAGVTAQAIRRRLRDPNEKHLRGYQKEGVKTHWMVSVRSLEDWLASLGGDDEREARP